MFEGIIITAITVSFIHAILPTHWLPFVLVGKAQKWSEKKTLSILFLAGGGHVFSTGLLGIISAFLGKFAIDKLTSISHFLSPLILCVFGLFYLILSFLKSHNHKDDYQKNIEEKGSIAGLVFLLTFSPCEGMIPIFIAASPLSWKLIAILALIMSLATLIGMGVLTSLALKGIQSLRVENFSKYEKQIIGGTLFVFGILLFLF